MIPARYAPMLFSLILSCWMSLLLTGVATLRTVGLHAGVLKAWLGAWLTGWPIAFPTVLVAAPLARRLVAKLCRLS